MEPKPSVEPNALPKAPTPPPPLPMKGAQLTQDASGRKVGFARPTLIIPPPQAAPYKVPYSATIPVPLTAHTAGPTPHPHQFQYMYPKRASEFMFSQFNGLRDFTYSTAKSGLGVGEKCSFWLYNKVSHWSKKWFTHMFLTLVVLIYTVGGALLFVYVEGENEAKIIEGDLRRQRYALIGVLRNLSMTYPSKYSEEEWQGQASRTIEDYEKKFVEIYKTHQLIVANAGNDKIWTFWNAVVYCGTIYTTIEAMDTLQTPTDDLQAEDGGKSDNDKMDVAKIEAMVTAEQVFSASVARKRRNLTRKRTSSVNSRIREQTPLRDRFDDQDKVTSTDEEAPEQRPKTPERRRKKVTKTIEMKQKDTTDIGGKVDDEKKDDDEMTLSKKYDRDKTLSNEDDRKMTMSNKDDVEKTLSKKGDNEKAVSKKDDAEQTPIKKDNVAKTPPETKSDRRKSSAQEEVRNLLNKAKRSLTPSSKKAKSKQIDKTVVKRSHSTPHQLTEEDLIESFRRAQILCSNGRDFDQKPSTVSRSPSPALKHTPSINFRPEVKDLVAQRKQLRQRSSKIIEILDPGTSKVIATTTNEQPKTLSLIKNLRHYSLFELIRNYRAYKSEMRTEYEKIRVLRNKCLSELVLIMIMCGLGGIMFKTVEGSFENFYKCGVKRIKRDFIDVLWYKSHNLREDDWKSLARSKLRMFEEELHVAHEAGMHSYSGQRSWSFLNGIVYALTIITTIGYGHMYPTTTTGMALTIVYAIIGIPLFLIALTDFGKLFTRCIKFVWSFVRRVYYTGSCRRARKKAHVQEIFKGAQMMYEIATFRRPSQFNLDPEVDPEHLNQQNPMHTPQTVVGEDTPTTPALSNYEIDDEFNLPISVAIFILVLYIFLGALIYCMWEHWDFFASFYFVFISMSTIGFGDYVPRHPICMIVSIIYLVFGLALMSMCINVVQVKLSDTFRQASAKIGATIGLTVAEDDGSITTVPPDPIEVPEIHNLQVPKTNDTNKCD